MYLYNSGTGNALFGSADHADGIIGTTHASTGQAGVRGRAVAAGAYGIFGQATFGDGGGVGVAGTSTISYGVYGTSTSGIGVYGQAQGFGVVGSATTSGGYGIYGLATLPVSAGFAGGSNNANAFAAVFGGRVVIGDGGPGVPGGLIVNGSLGITGTKSAIVPDGNGGHRLMYCVESPESWFEDFGDGTLSGGKADVKLAADFASTVDTTTLHVFLTPHDEQHVLHLTGRNGGGFTVTASPSALASGKKQADLAGTFTYRVVAKRKDVKAPRLAPVDLPQVKLTFPTLPAPPATS